MVKVLYPQPAFMKRYSRYSTVSLKKTVILYVSKPFLFFGEALQYEVPQVLFPVGQSGGPRCRVGSAKINILEVFFINTNLLHQNTSTQIFLYSECLSF
jgi:hypothetical protein